MKRYFITLMMAMLAVLAAVAQSFTGQVVDEMRTPIPFANVVLLNVSDSAYVAGTIEPYDMQQALCQRLCYSIDGEQVTLYDGHRLIATATNTVSDMGGFDDEQPLWIGEQLAFDLSGNAPVLLVTPGVKFNTGLVLLYDDMPTLRATLSISDEGMTEVTDITLQDNE